MANVTGKKLQLRETGMKPHALLRLWQNYLPLPHQPRLTTLARKRREYAQLVEQAFGRGMTPADAQVSSMKVSVQDDSDFPLVVAQIWHQIEIDVPRTRPGVPLWACEATQRVSGCFLLTGSSRLRRDDTSVARADTLRSGYAESSLWLCTRHQRPGYSIFRGIPWRLCQ